MTRNTLVLFLSDNGGCAEEIGPEGRAQHFPRRTRDGRPIRLGNAADILPGPEDTYASYGLEWAHASNTPFRLYKSFVHEGGIATPFIARWPGVIRAGTINRQVGHVIDLMPTLLAAAGVAPRPLEGMDLFHGDSEKPRTLYWEHEGNRAVRRGDFKLVAVHGGPWELYDLEKDRTELSDLAASRPTSCASSRRFTTAGPHAAVSSPGPNPRPRSEAGADRSCERGSRGRVEAGVPLTGCVARRTVLELDAVRRRGVRVGHERPSPGGIRGRSR